MAEFFHGWRRKFGLLTLLLTLMLLGGWVRSLNRIERFTFHTSPYKYNLIGSFQANVAWQQITPVDELNWAVASKASAPELFHEFAESVSERSIAELLSAEDKFNWRFRCCGIEWGERQQKTSLGAVQVTIWRLSYWSLIIPLTLISLWLLISKPRKSTQNKPVNHAPAKTA